VNRSPRGRSRGERGHAGGGTRTGGAPLGEPGEQRPAPAGYELAGEGVLPGGLHGLLLSGSGKGFVEQHVGPLSVADDGSHRHVHGLRLDVDHRFGLLC
jgi:hypothetical protein